MIDVCSVVVVGWKWRTVVRLSCSQILIVSRYRSGPVIRGLSDNGGR